MLRQLGGKQQVRGCGVGLMGTGVDGHGRVWDLRTWLDLCARRLHSPYRMLGAVLTMGWLPHGGRRSRSPFGRSPSVHVQAVVMSCDSVLPPLRRSVWTWRSRGVTVERDSG